MGKKGAKLTDVSSAAAEGLQQKMAGLGEIRIRKMFGGYGVFERDKMFALVDSGGDIFFKAGESNIHLFEEAGSSKHFRMPYYRVPQDVLAEEAVLTAWALSSIKASRDTK